MILSKANFFKICVLSQCRVYWIHFQNIHTFTYQKHYFIHFCCLCLKWLKAFSVSLNLDPCSNQNPSVFPLEGLVSVSSKFTFWVTMILWLSQEMDYSLFLMNNIKYKRFPYCFQTFTWNSIEYPRFTSCYEEANDKHDFGTVKHDETSIVWQWTNRKHFQFAQ